MTYSPNSVSKLASAKIESRSLGKSPLNVIKKEPGFEQERRSTQVNSDKGKVKSAHNVIEQRYRNKINDKFTALQHSVPTLRVILDKRDPSMSEEGLKESHLGDLDALSDSSVNLEGLEPATKLNKGTILAKTVEYIKFLEGKNKSLTMEYQQVLARAQMLGIEVEGNFQIKGRKRIDYSSPSISIVIYSLDFVETCDAQSSKARSYVAIFFNYMHQTLQSL
ncbi:hypothetical protein HF325_006106 [Metschnikowia pulcherrima]|uniref:BHLH domain-containing protein n=1 Tax=Metschnikowia pulcherrima TaxID=27326 RepID=A0A8H7L9L2_9ASCO|nr:hypothetical protein HF325_006106 [Metschnikowia pulcherrima]